MLRILFLSFVVAFGVGYLILRHAKSGVPRIGGVPIFVGCAAGFFAVIHEGRLLAVPLVLWLACLSPVLAVGLTADLTGRATPVAALIACLATGALAYALPGVSVPLAGLVRGETLTGIAPLAAILTCVVVAVVAHAFRRLDGLSGLASGFSLLALGAIAYVAFQVGDAEMTIVCGVVAAAVTGFRVWSYPLCRLALGAGGAYFLGAVVALLSIMLVQRHSEVSRWFPVALLLYPLWDTLFSGYRQSILKRRPLLAPDKTDMQALLSKRVPWASGTGSAGTHRNSAAAVTSLLLLAAGSMIPATLWWAEDAYLLVASLASVLVYLATYRRLVRFGTSRGEWRRRFAARHV